MKTEGDSSKNSSEDEELHKQEQHAVQVMPVEERPTPPPLLLLQSVSIPSEDEKLERRKLVSSALLDTVF
jgi:hypothetical protein